MKVTVFMPCYNAGRFLAGALDSILAQSFRDFRVLIVDDGSTDDSGRILEEYRKRDSRIRCVKNDGNRGIAYTRNKGLALCDTEYTAIMDADDIAPPDRLAKEFLFLEENPGIGAAGGQYVLLDEQGKKRSRARIRAFSPEEVKANLFLHNVIANSSVMYRSRIVKKYGLQYRDQYWGLEDYQFWCDFSMVSPIANLREVMLYYRVVETGLSRKSAVRKKAQREEVFDKIHHDFFRQNGFCLDEIEEQSLFPWLREGAKHRGPGTWREHYRIKQKLMRQAEQMDKEYIGEWKAAFWKVLKV